jgi:ABC-type cobalamin/Fe3+-siderophores transport system ATPase subunit
MSRLEYIKIQNFKIFGSEISIPLHHPTILIGANNSGKTSVIQALALWGWAIKLWYEKKQHTKSQEQRNKGVSINRLEIAQVPIKEARYFWNNAVIRQNGNDPISLTIIVGFFYEGAMHEVGVLFKYHSPDLIYCQPTEESFAHNLLLIQYAASLPIQLLYPMSGMSDKEYVFQEEAIRTQIGIGQTANVLRNICYHLYTKSQTDWEELDNLMHRLFAIRLKPPLVRATGVLELLYNYEGRPKATRDLDITLAGRGQQQMLLVLAYLLSNKGSVLMIDEPDAHLEILRQAQIFTVLKEVAQRYGCQLIIVTHSEVVLQEAASVVFLADGQAQEIADRQAHRFVRDALRNFGIEHYYKAKLMPRVLYIEGSTDLDILRAFASHYDHPAKHLLKGRIFSYYTQNESDINTLDNELERVAGAYRNFKAHFNALKRVVEDFRGLAIFDGDNKMRPDEKGGDLGVFYWQRYEIENYLATPEAVLKFAKDWIFRKFGQVFLGEKTGSFVHIMEQHLLLPVLGHNEKALQEFKSLPPALRQVQYESLASNKKISTLLENTFREFAALDNSPFMLTKGEFYRLVPYTEEMPPEIREKLDLVVAYLSPPQ